MAHVSVDHYSPISRAWDFSIGNFLVCDVRCKGRLKHHEFLRLAAFLAEFLPMGNPAVSGGPSDE